MRTHREGRRSRAASESSSRRSELQGALDVAQAGLAVGGAVDRLLRRRVEVLAEHRARRRDEADHRIVHLVLTPLGEKRIEELSRLHLEELKNLPRRPATP